MFLRTDAPCAIEGVLCTFVASPVIHAHGKPVERLVWIRKEISEDGNNYVREMASCTVRALPDWLSGRRVAPKFNKERVNVKGTLPSGKQYYAYRVALYADGFEAEQVAV